MFAVSVDKMQTRLGIKNKVHVAFLRYAIFVHGLLSMRDVMVDLKRLHAGVVRDVMKCDMS